jgi:chemotaxis protein methyltransferase CheR
MGFDEFLREAAPLLGLQWRPFQRRGIRRRVERRIAQIGLSNLEEYLLKIKEGSEERTYLSKILTVTISRFFRDREFFNILETSLIPRVIKKRKDGGLKIWSIGSASGEEPYSIALLWKERFENSWPQIHLSILATDIDDKMIGRAKEGRYKKSSLKEVPEETLRRFFKIENGFYVLDRPIRSSVEFRRHDIIHDESFLGMDLVFCRNLVFTYFSKECQISVLRKIFSSLKEDGYLAVGWDESLPLTYPTFFTLICPGEKIFQKFSGARS